MILWSFSSLLALLIIPVLSRAPVHKFSRDMLGKEISTLRNEERQFYNSHQIPNHVTRVRLMMMDPNRTRAKRLSIKSTGRRKFDVVAAASRYSYINDEDDDDDDDGVDKQKDVDESLLPALYDQVIYFRGQEYNKRGKRFRIYENDKKHLLKAYPTRNEIRFYETAQTDRDPLFTELRDYIPAYLGTEDIKVNDEVVKFLRVDNVAKYFLKPASMEIKIGLVRRASWLPYEAEIRELGYIGFMKKLGFGILRHVSYEFDGSVIEQGKKLGYLPPMSGPLASVSDNPIVQFVALYDFVHGQIGIKCGLIDRIIEELRKIESWQERQNHFRFYDSSILLTYDVTNLLQVSFRNGSTRINRRDCDEIDIPEPKVQMIHFGDTVPADTSMYDEDDLYLFGLRELIACLDELRIFYKRARED